MADLETETIRNLARDWLRKIPPVGTYSSISLNAGAGLYAVFLAQCASLSDPLADFDDAIEHACYGVDLMQTAELSTSYFRSLPGFGSAIGILDKEKRIDGAEDLVRSIDTLLCQVIAEAVNVLKSDLMDGLAGLMAYASVTNHLRTGNDLPQLVWKKITASASAVMGPLPWMVEAADTGGWDIGMAHGLAGILAACARADRLGLLPSDAGGLLRAGFEQLWSGRIPGGRPTFPSYLGSVRPSRLGWCYGVPGIAFSYAQAVHLDPDYRQRVSILTATLLEQLYEPSALLVDACLCHGYGGAAHMLRSLEKFHGLDSELGRGCEQGAKMCLAQTLAREEIAGAGTGFPHFVVDKWISCPTFLEGGFGVVLALLSCSPDEHIIWDKLILTDASDSSPVIIQ